MYRNLFDYEAAARQLLSREVFDYYAGGSGDEFTLSQNRTAFTRLALRPRVLTDVRTISLQTSLLGMPVAMPVAIAPTAYACLAHPEGERAVVRAAEATGTLAVMSINSSQTLEDIRAAGKGPLWQQFYLYPDRGLTRELLERITTAHYSALVITVDRPRLGKRERDLRNGFCLHPDQAANFAVSAVVPRKDACYATWKDIEWIHSLTSLPIVLKGILTAEDALLALEQGIAGIVISNHGGRQLDGAVTSMEALPEIVRAVDGRCEVYVDGGIRRGTDVLKALALGARAVLIGRPVLWGLAARGSQGVQHVLEILRDELELAMILCGCADLASISAELLSFPPVCRPLSVELRER